MDASTGTNEPLTRSLGVQVETRKLLTDDMYKRIAVIEASQNDHSQFFKKLQAAIDELTERYEFDETLKSPFNQDYRKDTQSTSTNNDSISLISTDSSNKKTDSVRKSKRKPKPKHFPDESDDDQQPASKKMAIPNLLKLSPNCKDIIIGPHGTIVSIPDYESITWQSASTATRKLLSIVFSNETLATHSLTGRPSPAFFGRERPLKMQLDPEKIADIIFAVTARTNATEREIRSAITTKCADTTKMVKAKEKRQRFSV